MKRLKSRKKPERRQKLSKSDYVRRLRQQRQSASNKSKQKKSD